MSAKSWMKTSVAALIAYLILAIICMAYRDHSHALMFLVGSMIWIVAIFIFSLSAKKE